MSSTWPAAASSRSDDLGRAGTPLEVDDDPAFERRERRAQRVGLALLTLLIAGAFLGLLGHGPLSRVTVRDGEAAVTYDRIARDRSPSRLTIEIGARAGEPTVVGISRAWVGSFEIVDISPQPDASWADDDQLWYEFASTSSADFRLRPETVGWITGEVSVGSARAQLGTLVFP